MASTEHLLDLAFRLRVQAGETHLPAYAMRMLRAAEDLEHLVAANENGAGAQQAPFGALPALLGAKD